MKVLPLVAVAIGVLLVVLYAMRHAPEYIKAASLKVEHPTTYRFTVYDGLLRKYVNKDGLVDYTHLKQDPDLQKAVAALESIAADKLENEKERASFWINASNLLTLKVIVDHYPITSIEQISQNWTGDHFMIGGEPTSQAATFNQATNQLDDKRLVPSCIFLLCKGSLGYPPLTDHAIKPETMDDDAKMAAYKFINDERNVFYDEEKLDFLLSPLFKRYEGILRRTHKDPHNFAVVQMDSKYPPDLNNMMITKTYFGKINPMLNDIALVPAKKEGE